MRQTTELGEREEINHKAGHEQPETALESQDDARTQKNRQRRIDQKGQQKFHGKMLPGSGCSSSSDSAWKILVLSACSPHGSSFPTAGKASDGL